MKHKKSSITALIAVMAVMSMTVVAFASAAPKRETDPRSGQNAPKTGYVYDHFQALEGDVMILSKGGGDGEKQYSVDGGKTWLSQEDYHAQYGGDDWQVEWWTAEDYAVWLEEEKQVLQSIIGERGYTGSEGWFTWDQKRVDETIALYERILEDIQNGALYSRTITDQNGGAVEDVMLGSGTLGGAEGFTSVQEDPTVTADTDEAALAAALEPYKAFGLDYEFPNEPACSLRMRWNGKPVHSLWDSETGTWYANNMHGTELGDGAVDLETVYRGGKLCGLQESQPPHEAVHGLYIPSMTPPAG